MLTISQRRRKLLMEHWKAVQRWHFSGWNWAEVKFKLIINLNFSFSGFDDWDIQKNVEVDGGLYKKKGCRIIYAFKKVQSGRVDCSRTNKWNKGSITITITIWKLLPYLCCLSSENRTLKANWITFWGLSEC